MKDKTPESLCERWTEMLEEGGLQRNAAVRALKGNMSRLTFECSGCRVVQLALQVASQNDAADLATELHGYVRRALASPYGNYVIQKVVTELPGFHASFVARELIGIAAEAARHRYGCRIICRLLEHSAADQDTVAVVGEVLQEVGDLCRHNFGHHVIQSILEHGLPQQVHRIAASLLSELRRNSRNRNAIYVLERALIHCSNDDKQIIASCLVRNPSDFVALAENQLSFNVARAVIQLPGETSQYVHNMLQHDPELVHRLQMSKYGSRVMDKLGCFLALKSA